MSKNSENLRQMFDSTFVLIRGSTSTTRINTVRQLLHCISVFDNIEMVPAYKGRRDCLYVMQLVQSNSCASCNPATATAISFLYCDISSVGRFKYCCSDSRFQVCFGKNITKNAYSSAFADNAYNNVYYCRQWNVNCWYSR